MDTFLLSEAWRKEVLNCLGIFRSVWKIGIIFA
jgi:hypothetical protein